MPADLKDILAKIVNKKLLTYETSWKEFNGERYTPMRKAIQLPHWLFQKNTEKNNHVTQEFEAVKENKTTSDNFFVIAECKKASPSKGIFTNDYQPERIAARYEKWGACAISVLCEEHFFLGSLTHLKAVRKHCSLPLLLKDFVLHEKQLADGLDAGADFALLIAKILTPTKMENLLRFCAKHNMAALIEMYDEDDIAKVNNIINHNINSYHFPRILLGINNRNLKNFSVDFNRSIKFLKMLPPSYPVISESGIANARNVAEVRNAGFEGALVGEALMQLSKEGLSGEKFFQQLFMLN